MFKTLELYCPGTNLLIDKIVDKAGFSSWLTSGMTIISVKIRANVKLQNFGHVNVKIYYRVAKKVYCAQSCFTKIMLLLKNKNYPIHIARNHIL